MAIGFALRRADPSLGKKFVGWVERSETHQLTAND